MARKRTIAPLPWCDISLSRAVVECMQSILIISHAAVTNTAAEDTSHHSDLFLLRRHILYWAPTKQADLLRLKGRCIHATAGRPAPQLPARLRWHSSRFAQNEGFRHQGKLHDQLASALQQGVGLVVRAVGLVMQPTATSSAPVAVRLCLCLPAAKYCAHLRALLPLNAVQLWVLGSCQLLSQMDNAPQLP